MGICIIGGAGFAGSGLTQRLLDRGEQVTIIDICSPLMAFNLTTYIDNKNLNYIWKAAGDISKDDLIGCEVICYVAAQADAPLAFSSPRYTITQNVHELIHVLEVVRDIPIKKFIYAGSGNEIGRAYYLPIDEEHPLTPHNPYGLSKAIGEMSCWSYYRCYGVPITILSNGACLGPNMRRDIFIYRWLHNLKKCLPVIIEGGNQTRDITYVSDILDAWILTIDSREDRVVGEKFQISYGKEESVSDILKMCIDITGSENPTIIHTDYRPGEESQREQFTIEKARTILGYAPQIEPYKGIELTWKWIKDEL